MTKACSARLYKQLSEESIAHRIRALRKSRGWTLAGVEKQSKGSFKAVVLGSYERGDRSLSIPRAIQLAEVFNIPLTELLCEPDPLSHSRSNQKLVIDLRKLADLRQGSESQPASRPTLDLFVAWIAGQRRDWNGEIMTIRQSDLDILGLMTFTSPQAVLNSLKENQLLMRGPNPL